MTMNLQANSKTASIFARTTSSSSAVGCPQESSPPEPEPPTVRPAGLKELAWVWPWETGAVARRRYDQVFCLSTALKGYRCGDRRLRYVSDFWAPLGPAAT